MPRFDLTSQAFKADPFPTLARLRDAGPALQDRLPIIGRIWLVTTYQAVTDVLRDHHRFVRDARNAGKNRLTDLQWWITQVFRSPARNMLAMDEPDHRRLRILVDDAFQRRSVEGIRSRVCEMADEILDQTIAAAGAGKPIEFLDFSRQFPLAVICELLGLPDTDRPRFTQWASGLSTVRSLPDLLKLIPKMLKVNAYFRREIRRCRAHPREGLLSLLTQVERDGDTLSEVELLAMAFLLLFAGHETTTHLICGSLLTLLDHPEQRNALMADWSRADMAVDELLRFVSPVQFTKPRIAAEDVRIGEHTIARGSYVLPMLASANTDPAQFAHAETLDLHRHPNPHVGFGTGIHVCLGLKLARLETAVAMERLLTRFPHVRLAIPRNQVQWTERPGMRSLRSLPLDLHG